MPRKTPTSTTRMVAWRRHLYRWRRWLIAAAVLVTVRMLLPAVLQHVIASEASKMLRARVVVGDVDLALYRGGVALKDVAVFPAHAGVDVPPLIAWKLFRVELRWLPLFRKTIQLREVLIDSPHVSIERLRDGGLNLAALLPAPGAPRAVPHPTSAAVRPRSGWGFGVDRLVLRTGAIRFHDLLMAQSEPIEIGLPALALTNIALRPGVYGQPMHALIEMKVDAGVLKIDSSVTTRADGIAADTTIVANDLPLRRTRVYIPRVGWSALRGTLSLNVTHRIDTNGTRHEIRGSIGLRNVTVHAPGFADTALALRALTVEAEANLVERRVAVADVDCEGLVLPVRSGGKEPLPVLAALIGGTPAVAPPAAPSSSVPHPVAAPPAAQPWHWSLAAARLNDARLLVLHDAARLDVAINAAVHDLAGEGDRPAAVKLGLGVGAGSVNVDGTLRLVPIGFGGRIVVDKLDLAQIAATSGVVAPAILPAAHLALDLRLTAGSLAPTPGDANAAGTMTMTDIELVPPAPTGVRLGVPALSITLDQLQVARILATQAAANQGDVHFRGRIHISGPSLSVAGMKTPTARVQAIDLALDDVSAPALLARHARVPAGLADADIRMRGRLSLLEPRVAAANAKEFAVAAKSIAAGFDEVLIPNARNASPRSLRVRLRDVSVASPSIRVTRTKAGLVLPQLDGARGDGRQPSPAVAKQPSRTTTGGPAATLGVDVSLATFRLTKGRIAFTDRAVRPYYSGLIAPLEIDVKAAHFPPVAAEHVRVSATVAPQGSVKAAGTMNPAGGSADVHIEDLDLAAFNPYAAAYSPYGIGEGSLTVSTKAAFASDGYRADSAIVLHNLDVTGAEGDSLFQRNFGIPLTVALALLKDQSGNIRLDVPVAADKSGMKVGIGTIVAGALRSALMGVLASPLKLVGMVVGAGKAQPSVPPQIVFRAGRPELTAQSDQLLKQLGPFVASRPGVGVTLEATPSTRDVRWLREQALAAELAKPQGVWGALKSIGAGGQRERIAKALAARANDAPGALDADDSKVLQEWLDRRRSPPAGQLQRLAAARVAKIANVLRVDYGVDASRITRGEAGAEAVDTPPVVRLLINPVRNGGR